MPKKPYQPPKSANITATTTKIKTMEDLSKARKQLGDNLRKDRERKAREEDN